MSSKIPYVYFTVLYIVFLYIQIMHIPKNTTSFFNIEEDSFFFYDIMIFLL
jgi:hypothetical protein